MSQPNTNPPPAATPVAPSAPTNAPAAPAAGSSPDESSLLANILGMIKPEEKKVTPPPADDKKQPAAPAPAASEPKPGDAQPNPAPAEPAKAPPAEPAPTKKVEVKKRAPALTAETVKETVKQAVQEAAAKQQPPAAPAATPPATPAAPVIPDDLTPEEKDEIELFKFIEEKDPSKKGLVAKGLKFVAENKKFIEARVAEEGADYDPSSDPRYRKFLAANQPQLTSAEKRRFTILREADGLKEEAYRKAKEELAPEIERIKRKQVEMEETPKITTRLSTYGDEIASAMPEDVVKFYNENGKDLTKLKDAFPLEYEPVVQSVAGAIRVAEEFLKVRSGVVDFDAKNPQHTYMAEFVDAQARVFAERGGDARLRDGKTFVHPYEMRPGMESTHWTFDNEDVLAMLKYQAAREAKARIQAEHSRLQQVEEARKKRSAAQAGAAAATTPPPAEESNSPSIPAAPAPGAAAPAAAPSPGVLSSILGFGTK